VDIIIPVQVSATGMDSADHQYPEQYRSGEYLGNFDYTKYFLLHEFRILALQQLCRG
jgi:hypothetical protein